MSEIIKTETVSGPFGEIYKKYEIGTPGRLRSISRDVLSQLNISIELENKELTGFSHMRENLNSEPGLLIANHPSPLDVFTVLSELEREDILMMVQKKRMPFFQQTIGADKVIAAPTGNEEIEEFLNEAIRHINSGGLFLLFPGGGDEIVTQTTKFRTGFNILQTHMRPQNMIYSIYIDPQIGQQITSELIGPPRDDETDVALIAPMIHVRPSPNELRVRLKERASEVSDWRSQIDQKSDPETINRLFTDYFLNQFDS